MTDEESLILVAFRAMDRRAKDESIVRMSRIAKSHPERMLRLVGGSITPDNAPLGLHCRVHNFLPASVVGGIVKIK